jgi:hypothetical protein
MLYLFITLVMIVVLLFEFIIFYIITNRNDDMYK